MITHGGLYLSYVIARVLLFPNTTVNCSMYIIFQGIAKNNASFVGFLAYEPWNLMGIENRHGCKTNM